MKNNIDNLRRLVQEKRLIPFIGAGFSKPLGLPTWDELIRSLAKQLDWDSDVFIQSGNFNYLQLAEYYVIEKSIGELRNELSKGMIISTEKIEQSGLHKALVDLNPQSIYTTNYDEGIENAFEFYKKQYNVIRSISDFKNIKENSTLIYKFHGDFVSDQSLVLTESSYFDRMEFEDPLDIRLRSDILNNTLLFLGYSLSDINTRYIFYRLSKINKKLKPDQSKSTAVMVTFGVSEIQNKILKSWGIEILELDPSDKTKGLQVFLESITR